MKLRKELWFGFSLMAIIIVSILWFTPWGHLANGHLGLLVLALIVVAIMLGYPTAFTLMGLGVFFAWLAYRSVNPDIAMGQTLDLMVQRSSGVMSNDVLIAVPLFVFMGYLVERAALIDRLFKSLHLATARVPGSLAVATVVTCAIFATATGIVGAVVTLMGLLAFPAMLKAGYNVKVAAGAVTAGWCLGILIPPSVLLIVYGSVAGVSVVQLYAGAFLPGFMLAGLYIGYIIVLAKWKPRLMPPLPESERRVELPRWAQTLAPRGRNALAGLGRAAIGGNAGVAKRTVLAQLFVTLVPALFIAALLGVTYRTATAPEVEASTAGLIEAGGLIAAPEQEREQSTGLIGAPAADEKEPGVTEPPVEGAKETPPAETRTAEGAKEPPTAAESVRLPVPVWLWITFAVGIVIIVLIYWLWNWERLEVFKMLLTSFFPLALNMTPVQFMILAQFIIFILGWPLEWTEIIIIFMPIFLPLLPHFGIDPLFFGLLVALNLQTAFLSPPVAMAAFYLKGVSPPHVTLNAIFAGMMPFMGIQLIALVLLYVFPQIGLWLPSVVYGR